MVEMVLLIREAFMGKVIINSRRVFRVLIWAGDTN